MKGCILRVLPLAAGFVLAVVGAVTLRHPGQGSLGVILVAVGILTFILGFLGKP